MHVLNHDFSSWGQYWAEMGFMRLEAGKNLLGIEGEVAWASKFQRGSQSSEYVYLHILTLIIVYSSWSIHDSQLPLFRRWKELHYSQEGCRNSALRRPVEEYRCSSTPLEDFWQYASQLEESQSTVEDIAECMP